jgi:hypothetical protein
MRVRAGRKYRYSPTFLDLVDARTKIKQGDIVRVTNLPGCPPANTMNHCYVQDMDGNFLGVVCCDSLVSIQDND